MLMPAMGIPESLTMVTASRMVPSPPMERKRPVLPMISSGVLKINGRLVKRILPSSETANGSYSIS